MEQRTQDQVWIMWLPLCCNKGVKDWFTGAEPWQIERYIEMGFVLSPVVKLTRAVTQ